MPKKNAPLINAIGALVPFVIAFFMAYIAYQQYKMTQYKEYCSLKNKCKKDIESIATELEQSFKKIIDSDSGNTIKKLIELVTSYESKFSEYEDFFDSFDLQWIKDSYKAVKEWFTEHDKFEWKWFYIKNSFNVITNFVAAFISARGLFMENPFNNTFTIYSLTWLIICKTVAFFVPVFIQRQYKKHIKPILFKLIALFFIIRFILYLIKLIFFTKSSEEDEIGNS